MIQLTPEQLAEIRVRVDRGIALCDRERPGWLDHIDLDRLDLESTCRCILGQEFAEHPDTRHYDVYLIALYELGVRSWKAPEYGFDAYSEDDDVAAVEYAALTAEWRRRIIARRETNALTPEATPC